MAGRTTTKQDVIKRVCHKTDYMYEDVKLIVQQFLDEVLAELARGGRLEFRDFGVFKAVPRKGRPGRNPKTGKTVTVPEQVVARFVPGQLMRERLAKLDPSALNDGKHTRKGSRK